MTYRIHVYDKTTERQIATMVGQDEREFAEIKRLAGVLPTDDMLGEYPLTNEAAREIGRLIHVKVDPAKWDYSVEFQP